MLNLGLGLEVCDLVNITVYYYKVSITRRMVRGNTAECPRHCWKTFSRILNIYIFAHSATYRLELCSTEYETAPKCNTSMEKFHKIQWMKHLLPTSTPSTPSKRNPGYTPVHRRHHISMPLCVFSYAHLIVLFL